MAMLPRFGVPFGVPFCLPGVPTARSGRRPPASLALFPRYKRALFRRGVCFLEAEILLL